MSEYMNPVTQISSQGIIKEYRPGVPVGGNGAGLDRSVNPAATLSLLVSIAANPARGGFYVQNQSAATIQIGLVNGGIETLILVDPGAGTNSQGADWSFAQGGVYHAGLINIRGSAGSQISCLEY